MNQLIPTFKLLSRFRSTILAVLFVVSNATIAFAQNVIKHPASKSTNVCADTQFKLTFATVPVLQSVGSIKLFKSDGTLVETIDMSLKPAGIPNAATWPWTQNLSGTAVKVMKVAIDDKTAIISFANNAMAYESSYYVTVDATIFANAAVLGFNGIYGNNWTVTTKAKPTTDLNYTVAADGTGDFATLQGALDYIPSGNATAAKIAVKNGIYVGLLSSKSKNNITIEGESVDGVILKGFNNNTMNAAGSSARCFANFSGNDLNFINLTFINTTPDGGSQAEVITLSGDRNVFVNCKFFSYQDTLLISGKTYMKDCLVEGNVDFIWGNGGVFFQSCEIRTAGRSGYTVQARNGSGARGYAFADCILSTASPAITGHVLGRDAGASTATNIYAEIIYLNCTLGSHISSKGWNFDRVTVAQASTALIGEYKSVDSNGNLIDVSARDAKSKQLTDAQNTQYRNLSWFFGGWTPVLPTYSLDKKPTVSLTSPTNGAMISNTGSVLLTAIAADADGSVASVEFFDGTTLLTTLTSSPFTHTLSNASLGTHILSAVATDNMGLKTASAAVSLTVTVPVTGVDLPSTETVNKNETVQLTATVLPADDTNKNITWSSRNDGIAKVDPFGIVIGVAPGDVHILVTTEDGNFNDSCLVTVTNIFRPVTGVTLAPTSATVNKKETVQLNATISPGIATNKNMTWSSDNQGVASVSQTGLVTAVSVGSAIITVSTEDGNLTAICTITTVDPPLPNAIIKLGFNENTGSTVANEGSVSATFTKAEIPAWSSNVPVNGGTSSVDFGTTTGNNFVESSAVISQLGGLTSFTITGWVNCRSSSIGSGGNRILSWINEGGGKAGVDVVNLADGTMKVGINEFSDNTVAVSSAGKVKVDANASASNWVFFALTYNSSINTFKFLFGNNSTEAVLDKSITCSRGVVGTTIGKLAIGALNTESQRAARSDRMFRGLIDQIQVYGSALTLNNIHTVQNIGAPVVLVPVHDGDSELVNIFPNPVTNLLNVACSKELTKNAVVDVLDLTAKSIVHFPVSGKNQTLDVSALSNGIYLVKVSDSGFTKMTRIIKR